MPSKSFKLKRLHWIFLFWALLVIYNETSWVAKIETSTNIISPSKQTSSADIISARHFFRQRRLEVLRDERGKVPSWIWKYAQWHSEQMRADDIGQERRYLILECTKWNRCGGLADRLRYLPVYLLLAHRTRRIIVIRWTHPWPLEEFLLPPPKTAGNFLDWRMKSHPELMRRLGVRTSSLPKLELLQTLKYKYFATSLCASTSAHNLTVLTNDLEAFVATDEQNEMLQKTPIVCLDPPNKSTFSKLIPFFEAKGGCLEEVLHREAFNSSAAKQAYSYSKIWRSVLYLFFEPSPPIFGALDEQRQQLGLQWGDYAAAHLRARHPDLESWYQYQSKGRRTADAAGMKFVGATKNRVIQDSKHAVECALQLMRMQDQEKTSHSNFTTDSVVKDYPVYFASDTIEAVHSLVVSSPVKGLVPASGKENPHLERAHLYLRPRDYYPIFVDLFLLAGARCVAVGVGGYGLFAGVWSSGGECVGHHMVLRRDGQAELSCQRIQPSILPFAKSTVPLKCKQPSP